jgi:hypothetical protein
VLIESADGDEELPITANQSRALALERENNFVPWRVDRLSDAALAALDNLLVRICLHPKRVSKDALAGAALLQAALVTGRRITDLAAMPIIKAEPSSIEGKHQTGFYHGSEDWAWWLTAGKPSSAQHIPAGAEGLYRPTQANMFMLCGHRTQRIWQGAFAREALETKPAATCSADAAILKLSPPEGFESWTTSAARKLTSATLRLLPPSHRHALSAKRVENWLFWKLVEDTGELAQAAILTDRVTSSSNAKLHYSWISSEGALRRIHHHTADRELIGQTDSTCGEPICRLSPKDLANDNVGFGSRFVLKQSSVRRLRDYLLAKIATPRATAEFHHFYTLYTMALVGFAAGLRPKAPFLPDPSEINQNGWVIWEDKNSSFKSHRRLLWLPAVAVDQLRLYDKHLHRIGNSYGGRELICDGKPRKATAKVVAAAFANIGFPIQPNAWRHYLRTELLGSIQGDVLMACMGHWQRGQDPWSVYSAFCPMKYRDALDEHLNPLLKRDGWRAMPSLGPPPAPRDTGGIPAGIKFGSEYDDA